MSVDTSQMFCFAARTLIGCTPWPEFRKNSRNTGAAVPQSGGGHFHDMAMSTNGFSLLVSAPTNTIDCICATRDFVTWTNLGELVLTNSTTNFLDTGATNYRYRFYRAYPQ